jgi:hypothetical protein
MPVCQTASELEESPWVNQIAYAAAQRAEPIKIIARLRADRLHAPGGNPTILASALEIGFDAVEYPIWPPPSHPLTSPERLPLALNGASLSVPETLAC